MLSNLIWKTRKFTNL